MAPPVVADTPEYRDITSKFECQFNAFAESLFDVIVLGMVNSDSDAKADDLRSIHALPAVEVRGMLQIRALWPHVDVHFISGNGNKEGISRNQYMIVRIQFHLLAFLHGRTACPCRTNDNSSKKEGASVQNLYKLIVEIKGKDVKRIEKSKPNWLTVLLCSNSGYELNILIICDL